ncbi:sugar phosphate isomerase/epimerase family protein [Amorphus orientalis]|uniref:D-psicose/D-tagatose/L-ribulose 3-epimerase n=1 Tax=Amorphus orientalis TaxID=649198 RepID=A0AAE4AT26_9HYPH|nr:sugar phosphate isomerase/epimerase [Amorphus orientalis]MDQ0315913.1 D-psicose/D-tagatose/L-ribulose 3-epimerase [Amorphus orientalis]
MEGKLGVHALIFGDDWSAKGAEFTCRSAVEIGYELIELLMFDPFAFDLELTRRVVPAHGLGLRLGMALGPEADISSTDSETAERGEHTVARALEIAAELGAPGVSGITYAAFASYGAGQTETDRRRVAERLSRLDRRAGDLGVKLGLEPVNRYESYMVNTLDQAAALIREVDGRNMFVHMDTFHMNIEEADIAGSIARNAPLLGHAHVAENHRGVVGSGTFDLAGYFRALARADYQGDFVAEGFSGGLVGPDLVAGVRLWRSAYADPVTAARIAFQTMQAAKHAAVAAVRPW